MSILATAFAKGGSERHETALMTVDYGKGRVFHTVIGYSSTSMHDVAFQETLIRGTEWAATGKVTFPEIPIRSFHISKLKEAYLRDKAGPPENDLIKVYRTLEAFEGIGIFQRILLSDSDCLFELTEPEYGGEVDVYKDIILEEKGFPLGQLSLPQAEIDKVQELRSPEGR